MLDIDAERVVADMGSFKANVLMINAAGIIASYPTKLPYHFQSPFLKGDSLQTIIAACHRADIRVMARTDFSKVRYPIYEATRNGRPSLLLVRLSNITEMCRSV